jgi:protein-tyrosine phosphatase
MLSSPIYKSYWIIPGRFRAGEFPGIKTASEATTDDEARRRLRWLLEGGTNYFVDLTQQGELGLNPYDQLLNEEAKKIPVVARHNRIPLKDFNTPAIEKVVEILDTIELALSLGKNIYLHCHAGKGRTGTVVGCYLVRQGLSGKAALELLQKLRKDIPGHEEQSPETEGQIRMVLEWKKGQ